MSRQTDRLLFFINIQQDNLDLSCLPGTLMVVFTRQASRWEKNVLDKYRKLFANEYFMTGQWIVGEHVWKHPPASWLLKRDSLLCVLAFFLGMRALELEEEGNWLFSLRESLKQVSICLELESFARSFALGIDGLGKRAISICSFQLITRRHYHKRADDFASQNVANLSSLNGWFQVQAFSSSSRSFP